MARPISDAKRKRAIGLTLSQDAAQLLIDQASEKGISVSAYVERFVLEQDWKARTLNEKRK